MGFELQSLHVVERHSKTPVKSVPQMLLLLVVVTLSLLQPPSLHQRQLSQVLAVETKIQTFSPLQKLLGGMCALHVTAHHSYRKINDTNIGTSCVLWQFNRGGGGGGGGGGGRGGQEGLNFPLPMPCTPSPHPFCNLVPASLCFFYCKILHNVANCFPISPSSCHLGNPTSRRLPAPLSPRPPPPPPPPPHLIHGFSLYIFVKHYNPYTFLCCSLKVIIEFSISSMISLSFSTNSGDGFTSCRSRWNLFTFDLIFPNCCFSLCSVKTKKYS